MQSTIYSEFGTSTVTPNCLHRSGCSDLLRSTSLNVDFTLHYTLEQRNESFRIAQIALSQFTAVYRLHHILAYSWIQSLFCTFSTRFLIYSQKVFVAKPDDFLAFYATGDVSITVNINMSEILSGLLHADDKTATQTKVHQTNVSLIAYSKDSCI